MLLGHILIVHPNLIIGTQITLNLWPCVCMMCSRILPKSPHGRRILITFVFKLIVTVVDSVALIPVFFLNDNLYHRVAQIPVIPKVIFVAKDNTMIWRLCSSLLKNQLFGNFFI